MDDDIGWRVLSLSDESMELIAECKAEIASLLVRDMLSLEGYCLEDNAKHEQIHVALGKILVDQKYGRRIIEKSLPLFIDLLGPDLHVQKYPYFRIARPGVASDNIGMHRDTYYGGSPHEVSVVIPLTEMPDGGALRVVDYSSVASDVDYPFTRVESDVERNSDKHRLGFLYAPKKLADEVELASHPVTVHVGQALVFPLSLVHGQAVNRSPKTRFSIDVRLVNSFAPIQWSKSVHSDFYEPLCQSWVTTQANRYKENNAIL